MGRPGERAVNRPGRLREPVGERDDGQQAMTKPAHVLRPSHRANGAQLHNASEAMPGLPLTGGARHWRQKAPATPRPEGPVVPQIGPTYTHDPRYQCAPDERPAGAGFVAAGVGIDVTTGKPWGAGG